MAESIEAGLKALVAAGFFNRPRSVREVQAELKEQGQLYEEELIAEALNAFLQKQQHGAM